MSQATSAAAAPGPGELRTCYKCECETTEVLALCPRCKFPLQTTRQIRRRGWVLAVTGAFLLAFMGTITVIVTNIVLHTDEPGATSRFTGNMADLVFMYSIFGLVLAFGLTSLVAGVWQIWRGKRNRQLTWIALGIALVLLVAAQSIRLLE